MNPNGWRVGYFPTIMDGPVARFRRGLCEVSASRERVHIRDTVGITPGDEQAVVAAATAVHTALRAAHETGALWGADNDERVRIIQEALGPAWTVERPRLFETWPPETPS